LIGPAPVRRWLLAPTGHGYEAADRVVARGRRAPTTAAWPLARRRSRPVRPFPVRCRV